MLASLLTNLKGAAHPIKTPEAEIEPNYILSNAAALYTAGFYLTWANASISPADIAPQLLDDGCYENTFNNDRLIDDAWFYILVGD